MSSTDAYVVKLLRQNVPHLLHSLRQAAKKSEQSARIVRLKLSQFEDNPLVLYAALAFARTLGVTVTFSPDTVGEAED